MRVDIPTLRCDRCGFETQDLTEMSKFNQLAHHHQSGTDNWDLCPSCWALFRRHLARPLAAQPSPASPDTEGGADRG